MRARAATIAGFLSLATAVHATGNAIINNNCDYDVYLWPVSVDESPSESIVIDANGGHWSQAYKTCTTGGMSLKLSGTNDVTKGITQFEYTLEPGNIWYDISNVNCLPFGKGTCPFSEGGMTLKSGSGCPVATCEGGNDTCHDAYTYPKDDWASLACVPSADTTLTLCGSSSSGSSSDGIIGQLSSAASSLVDALTSSTEAAPSSTTPTTTAEPTTSTTPTPTPTPTTSSTTSSTPSSTPSSSEAEATPAAPSYHHQWSAPVAVSDLNGVAVAAVATSSSPAASPSTTEEVPSSSIVATTFATVAVTTPAPENPNVAVVYETVTTMVSTTVVYQHKMFHKERRSNAHPHARRHQHEQ